MAIDVNLIDRVQAFLEHKELGYRLVKSSIRLTVVFIGALCIWFFLRLFFSRLQKYFLKHSVTHGELPSESERRAKTLVGIVRTGLKIILGLMVLLTFLNEFGVSIGPILASAGVASLAVGFGAQNLVKDVIAGFFIILENQIRVGDYAEINSMSGFVQEINFRTTLLRDTQGAVHIFPNGGITQISNFTKGWSAYVMYVTVSYKENLVHVMQIMRDTFQELRRNPVMESYLLEPELEIFGLDKFGDYGITLKARIKTLPLKQWEAGRAYNLILKSKFDEANIEIPGPLKTIYVGGDTVKN